MAVRIRCKRLGRKNRPFYRISVFDARTRRDGRSIEDIGTYDVMTKNPEQTYDLKVDRLKYWLSVGAQPSETVASIVKKLGLTKKGIEKTETTTQGNE